MFREIIHEFTGTTNVGFYMIHLERSTERLGYMHDLEVKLNMKIPIVKACEGDALVQHGHPTRSIYPNDTEPISAGNVGCTVSHINICKDAIAKKYDYIVIFEDDCKFNGKLQELNIELQRFRTLGLPWDLFLLGGFNEGTPIPDTSCMRVHNFGLTHACLLNNKFMNELIALYESYYQNNTTYAIDGIYARVLKGQKAIGYGFISRTAFFEQYNGVYSYIINNIRYH